MLEQTLESPMDYREIKQIINEINPDYSLDGQMLKLKLQYFSHLMGRANSLEKTLMLGKIEGRRRRGQRRMRWLDGITNPKDMSLSKFQASLPITNSWSLLKLMFIMSAMLSCHLIFCCPLLLPSILPSSGSFQ